MESVYLIQQVFIHAFHLPFSLPRMDGKYIRHSFIITTLLVAPLYSFLSSRDRLLIQYYLHHSWWTISNENKSRPGRAHH
jgi:outer membrane phospholipase A